MIDLSGAHRFRDPGIYESWYGFEHPVLERLASWSYGLPEVSPPVGRLVANPGCYATAALLALAPVSCAAACAVVDALDEGLLASVLARGAELAEGLTSLPGILSVRGRGLLLGAVVEGGAAEVVEACRERGLLALTAGDDVVRLAPPLTSEAGDVEEALSVLVAVLGAAEPAAKLQVVT